MDWIEMRQKFINDLKAHRDCCSSPAEEGCFGHGKYIWPHALWMYMVSCALVLGPCMWVKWLMLNLSLSVHVCIQVPVSGILKTTHAFCSLLERHRAQHMVVPTTTVYCREGTQGRIKGAKTGGVCRNPCAGCGVLSLLWRNESVLLSQTEKNVVPRCHISAQRSPFQTQHPGILLWDWSHRSPLPSNYRNSRLPEGSRCST